MRRDMDLVRKILVGSAEAGGTIDARAFVNDSHDEDEIAYHLDIMAEAGLVRATVERGWSGHPSLMRVDSLTWAGNDFLDAVSNDKVWARVRAKVYKLAGAATFDVIKAMAVKELSAMLL